MAAAGGGMGGLRARGDVEVAVSWLERRAAGPARHATQHALQQANSSAALLAGVGVGVGVGVGAGAGAGGAAGKGRGGGEGTIGGKGLVLSATLVFHSPHPWYAPHPHPHPSHPSNPPPAMTEDAAGFFSWAPYTPQTSAHVTVVYPYGRRALRLHASYLVSPTAATPCAQVVAGGEVIPSENITAAANPGQFLEGGRGGGGGGGGYEKGAPRRGIGLRVFDFPCKVILRP